MSPQDRRTRARQLRDENKSTWEIARELGVGQTTVRRYLDDKPSRPAGRATPTAEPRHAVHEVIEPGSDPSEPPTAPGEPQPEPPAEPGPPVSLTSHPEPTAPPCPRLTLDLEPRLMADLQLLRATLPGSPNTAATLRAIIRASIAATADTVRQQQRAQAAARATAHPETSQGSPAHQQHATQ